MSLKTAQIAGDFFGNGRIRDACCLLQGECVITSEANCVAAKGTYRGDGGSCARAGCPTPTCLADIVDSATFLPPPDGNVDGADLAYLLGAWGACE